MFDIAFSELMIVAIVAIIALGPDKLPKAILEVVKLFKAVKKNITNIKDTLEDEVNIEDMKRDIASYEEHLTYTKNEIMKNPMLSDEESQKRIDEIDALNEDIRNGQETSSSPSNSTPSNSSSSAKSEKVKASKKAKNADTKTKKTS